MEDRIKKLESELIILDDEIEQLAYLVHKNLLNFSMEDRRKYADLSDKIHMRRNRWVVERHKFENLKKYGKEKLR